MSPQTTNNPQTSWSRWVPVVIWMSVIFFFSSRPRPLGPLSEGPYGSLVGRLAHIGEYAILALLIYRALSERATAWQRAAAAFTLAFAYALTDELHQITVPGRECSWIDLIYDAVGAAVAVLPLAYKPIATALPAPFSNWISHG